MLKGFLYLPFATALMTAAVGSDDQLPELRIEVITGDSVSSDYSASIERNHDRRPTRSEALPADGVWRFRDVPYGEYRVTVMRADGALVYDQGITVDSRTSTMMLSLPVKMRSLPISGTVSVAQLIHPVPQKAVSSFRASQKLIDRGDFERAARELEKAIEVSPGYADAYESLAAVHIKMGSYEQALTEISEAISVAGPNAQDLSNEAIAHYHLRNYAETIKAARWALRLDPNYDPAHLILGATLALDKRTMAESVPHLERAAKTLVSAKTILAIVRKALSHD